MKDDISGPHTVGIETILVDRGNKFSPTEDVLPDHVVKDISEIEKLCL